MENKQSFEITTGSWIRGVVVIVLAYAIYLIREFLLVVIVSIIIASALEPAIKWTKKRNIPRSLSVFMIFVIMTLGFAGIFYFLLLPIVGEMSSFVRTLTIYFNSVSNGGLLSEMFINQNIFGGFDTPAIVKELSSYLNSLTSFLSQGVFSSLSLVFGGLLNFILIIVLSFYLIAQEDGVSKFLKMITPLKHEQYILGLWQRSQNKIGLWMQGQLIMSAVVTVLVYIGLLIVGVPQALMLAVLAGIFELIPLIGATMAAIPALFIAYMSGGMSLALLVAGIYILVQQLEGNVIYPLVVKKIVGVSPMFSIIALVVGGTLAGFLGVLIAIPVAAALGEFVSDFEARKIKQSSSTNTLS